MRFLDSHTTGVWILDVQTNLFPKIFQGQKVLEKIFLLLDAALILQLPLFITEQYPQGLGPLIAPIKEKLPHDQVIYQKTAFSGWHDLEVRKALDGLPISSWILVGIETHICILQTAKDLLLANKDAVVLSDATSSRVQEDHMSAIEELRSEGIRISHCETVIYELMRDAAKPEFKQLLHTIKQHA